MPARVMSATVMPSPQPAFGGARGGGLIRTKSHRPAQNRLQIQIAGPEAHEIRTCTDRLARDASAVLRRFGNRPVTEHGDFLVVRGRLRANDEEGVGTPHRQVAERLDEDHP